MRVVRDVAPRTHRVEPGPFFFMLYSNKLWLND